mmetsp:Transcript_142432/g.248443  ORF Transcript_142432/g.248443 Transcript_142432/m.248443 type:complete len:164 (-) Transcript_142432:204-695(-)
MQIDSGTQVGDIDMIGIFGIHFCTRCFILSVPRKISMEMAGWTNRRKIMETEHLLEGTSFGFPIAHSIIDMQRPETVKLPHLGCRWGWASWGNLAKDAKEALRKHHRKSRTGFCAKITDTMKSLAVLCFFMRQSFVILRNVMFVPTGHFWSFESLLFPVYTMT